MDRSKPKAKIRNKAKNLNLGKDKFINTPKEAYVNIIAEIPLAFENLITHQNNDEERKLIVQSIKYGNNSEKFSLKNQVLMYNERGKNKIYVPESLFNLIYTFYHSALTGCHLSIARTYFKINEYFIIPKYEIM